MPRGLTLGGYIQAEYDGNRFSEDQLDATGAPRNLDRFYVRRARLRVDHGWQFAAATLEIDVNSIAGPSVGVRRAEATLLYRGEREDSIPLLAFSAGITDLPFGYELAESARVRPFLERSPGSNAIFPTEMDAGIKLWGAAGFLRYALALTDGEPLDPHGFPRDPNKAKDLSGRFGVDLEAAPGVSLAGGTSFSLGKGFHAGSPGTKNSVVWRDDNENNVVDPGELVGVPGSAPTPSRDFDRWALGLDLELGVKSALGSSRLFLEGFVASNYDRGLYVADPILTGVDLREAGFSASLLQSITSHGLIGFRYTYYDPNSDLIEQRRGNLEPRSAAIRTFSPLLALEIQDRARLVFEYDFVRDHLARDARGVPTDADNDQFGARLQVEL